MKGSRKGYIQGSKLHKHAEEKETALKFWRRGDMTPDRVKQIFAGRHGTAGFAAPGDRIHRSIDSTMPREAQLGIHGGNNLFSRLQDRLGSTFGKKQKNNK